MKPKLFFMFLLIFNCVNFLCAQKYCPPNCTCAHRTVGCRHVDLYKVPSSLPSDTITLDLRFTKIRDLVPGSFRGLTQLRSLLLHDNQITSVNAGAFAGLKNLRYLYLYRNKIQYIDPEVFNDVPQLEQLYLHFNEIRDIMPSTFTNMRRLNRLYLHNNKISRIQEGSFNGMKRLRKLRLNSNPLVCDCSMTWIVGIMSGQPRIDVEATCYKPARLTGVPFSAMSETDFDCQQPRLTAEPEDTVVEFGKDAMLTCTATGKPPPEIIWLRDSDVIPTNRNRYEVFSNGSLMVHSADKTDSGVFECLATNVAGQVHSKPVKMVVNVPEDAPPVFVLLPAQQTVKENQTVNFDCVVNGNPKPHIAWFYNHERILLTERVSMHHNGSLVIKNVDQSDAGTYICQGDNVYGRIRTFVELTVNVPPTFEVMPRSQTVKVGDNVILICKVKGVPEPTISWFKNILPLQLEANIIMSADKTNLTILEVTEEDNSLFNCKAENSEGFAEATAILTIEEVKIIPPHIILKPEDFDTYSESTVQLPCEVEAEPAALIEWRKDGSRVVSNDRFSITIIGSLIIHNATVTDTGRYECTVFNDYGRDTASSYLTVRNQILPQDAYVNIALTHAIRDVDQAIERTMHDLFNNKSTRVDLEDLYRIARFPNAPAREVARAAEIYERTLDKVKEYIEKGKKVSPEAFNYQNFLSNEHLEVISRLSGCVAHRDHDECDNMCFLRKYRHYDGTCNNFAHPTWGSSLTGFRRLLFPIYENGFSQPIGWNKGVKYNGHELPSSRLVSTRVITTADVSKDDVITHMVMQWGQWLDHDLDHALPSVSSQTWDGVDCKKTCDYAPPCFPIEVPLNDSRVVNRRCIDFIRTSAVCGSGMTSVLFGALQPREQINQLTSFIDASQVYGFEESVAKDLRDATNGNGLLRVGAAFPGKKPLLPTSGLNEMDCRRNLDESTRPCFVAGDIRANEQIGLAAFHTIWMREHNRVALTLKITNPFWDGNKIYQESRKIVGAEIQHITYEHWLPIILGPEGYKQIGKYTEYNPNIDPSISNVFATAALRFGHSMINPILHRYDENFEPIPEGHLLLHNAFFAPWRLVDEGGVDPLMRGMFTTPAKLKKPKQNLNTELTEKLFYNTHAVALDLAAINIQRGRDHGIPSYTKFRQFCNLSEVNDFEDLAGEISDREVRQTLKELYGSVHNIDVWVGGILEDQVEGGKVGPLFRCLLVEQFIRLRDGDRYWYENPSAFKPEQLWQIKQTSLARILCDNGDNIDTIGENVFYLPEVQDGMVSCDYLPSIDFRYWADCEKCNVEDVDVKSEDDSQTYGTVRHYRARRQVTPASPKSDVLRLKELTDTQEKLDSVMQVLKQRIDYLEQSCKTNDHP